MRSTRRGEVSGLVLILIVSTMYGVIGFAGGYAVRSSRVPESLAKAERAIAYSGDLIDRCHEDLQLYVTTMDSVHVWLHRGTEGTVIAERLRRTDDG